MNKQKLIIIIPCYNEEESIEQLFLELEKIDKKLSELYICSFLFVDDGSTDSTHLLLSKNVARLESVKIIQHTVNQNLGMALQTAIKSITDEDLVAFLDSDCTYEPKILFDLIDEINKGYDLVTVSPYHPDGRVDGVPEWRLLLSKGITLIYRILLWKKMYTFTAMVRVIKRDKIDVLVGTRSDFAFVAEMMISAIKRNYKISEVPTVLKTREFGVSKMRLMNTIYAHLEIVWKLIKREKF
jgi:dolichol-phosphate mannosyltransferase